MLKKVLAATLALLFAAALAACSYTPSVTGIAVKDSAIEIHVSEMADVEYDVLLDTEQDGFALPAFHSVEQVSPKVTFSYPDNGIVMVDNSGKIAALKP